MEQHDVNEQVQLAHDIIENTNANLFLTGRAGTGKTTFLHNLRANSPKRMAVLAPTGIAAINAQGVTIHSFFQIAPGPYVPNGVALKQQSFSMRSSKIDLICSLDLLVIDEVSMVRADMLDEVDDILRRLHRSSLPFGGVQLLLIGDMQQLSPVVTDNEWEVLRPYYDTPYFFSSKALQRSHYLVVELNKVYRQTDKHFLSLLNSVRSGACSQEVLDMINTRYVANFKPTNDKSYIQLCTHNWQAKEINQKALDKLDQKLYVYKAKVKGKFPNYSYPTDDDLQLKLGAQVMFVKNDSEKKYFNGMIGTVVDISDDGFTVCPKSDTGQKIEVKHEEWKNTRYGLDKETKEIKEFVDGVFVQYPVKLAWAITIHKSQGLTFDNVMIDASKAFAHGQTYVALSRCRTLEGIVLTSPIPPSAVINDPCIAAFNNEIKERAINEEQLSALKINYSEWLIHELFSFEKECIYFAKMSELMQKHLYNTYTKTILTFGNELHKFNLEVMNVSGRFHQQYHRLLHDAEGEISSVKLQERLQKGAVYFQEKLDNLLQLIEDTQLDIDNAQVRKEMNSAKEKLTLQLRSHIALLQIIIKKGFDRKSYLKDRVRILLSEKDNEQKKEKKKSKRSAVSPSEVEHTELYDLLQNWRREKAVEQKLPAYCILQTKCMIAISNMLPSNKKQLQNVPYLGAKGIEKYGEEIIAMVADYKKSMESFDEMENS